MRLYSGRGRRIAGRQGRRSQGGKRLCAGRGCQARELALLLCCAGLLTAGALYWANRAAAVPAGNDTGAQARPIQEVLPSPEEDQTAQEPAAGDDDDGRFLLSFAGDYTLGMEQTS